MSNDEWARHTKAMKEITYYCKCGGKALIPFNKNKGICNSCRNYVFKNSVDKTEYDKKMFKTKVLALMK